MQPSSSERIRTDIDSEGRLVLSWDVMERPQARLMACLLGGVAALWAFLGRAMPVEFWGLVKARESEGLDWVGLTITGIGTVFFFAPFLLAVAAVWRLAVQPQPERLTLGHGKLVYEPGAAALIPVGNRATPLRQGLLNIAKLEVAREEFGGAAVEHYKRFQFVSLQMGPRTVRIGQFLRVPEQQQLVRNITAWQQQG